ncbi:hypothetical protein YK48G_17470 [Lentilactobacillus fungorum]|uniref:Peptidase M10 metallopeptidase domain-containing protein n=1 Tax=Lentilactobacillus fungorum TaxID=2201250 RepID=A0ABQ3W1D5_9LACO|nr:M57 family metalloprotease [Lentilactobacillus fungorum]GHP14322.1 hypothetical protein YK48G_17470 [Lentilactobacillus fungorum]
MNFRNKLISILLLSTLSTTVSTVLSQPISLKAKTQQQVKVIWRHQVRPTKFKLNQTTTKRAYAYSAQLAHRKFRLANYRRQSFTVYYHQKLRVNGQNRIYYFAKSATKQSIKGWIWRGYLTKATVKSSSKTMTKAKLNQLISAAPDLEPDHQILNLNQDVYHQDAKIFNKQYNVGNFSVPGTFFQNHATIYVEDKALENDVSAAISKWNHALGSMVFSLGSKPSSSLIVKFGDGSATGWDGLFNGFSIQVNQQNFENDHYVSANTVSPGLQAQIKALANQASQFLATTNAKLTASKQAYEAQSQQLKTELSKATTPDQQIQITTQLTNLTNSYEANQQAIKDAYNAQIEKIKDQIKADYNQEQATASTTLETHYWITVITHELGHALGLYHTPYQNDIMYAPTDNETEATASPVKYSWTDPKDPDAPKAYETATLSSRDINRAKLTKLLGYW